MSNTTDDRTIRYVHVTISDFLQKTGYRPCDCNHEKLCNSNHYMRMPFPIIYREYLAFCDAIKTEPCIFDDFFLDLQRSGFWVIGGGNVIQGMIWGTHVIKTEGLTLEVYD